jgi:hypothetical protein
MMFEVDNFSLKTLWENVRRILFDMSLMFLYKNPSGKNQETDIILVLTLPR